MSDYESAILNTYAIIQYDGFVELVSHALLVSICNVDVQYYPFDQQICELTFASWTYDIDGVRHSKTELKIYNKIIQTYNLNHFNSSDSFRWRNNKNWSLQTQS